MDEALPDLDPVLALLLDTDTYDAFLEGLADAALALAPGADGCGITLERQGRPLTVASVGTSAPRLDEAQYGQDDGPCLQALRKGQEVSVPDMLLERRWGDFPSYAAASGTRASLSVPISAHSTTAGALNLYSPQHDGFADAPMVSLRALTAQATGAIALARRIADAEELAADLQAALRSRTVIDQAIGVIMGQQRCTAEKAFGILRSASQHRNIKLRDLCAELISGITGGPPTEDGIRPRP